MSMKFSTIHQTCWRYIVLKETYYTYTTCLRIPTDWWSCWERTLHRGARTNNACEGFNSMAGKLSNKHADIYTLLQSFILPDNVLEEKFIDS